MADISPVFLAMITGFVSGLLLSIPIGPVNLTIINEGARRGFLWAALIGLGASSMEAIYCTIAFTGFSSLFETTIVKTSMEVFSFAFFLFLGARFLMAKNVTAPTQLVSATEKIEARLGEKLHPHSAYMTGFVRVFGNFGVLLFWIGLAAYLMSHQAYFTTQDFVADTMPAKLMCVVGVVLGANSWFFVLSYGVSRGQGRFNEKTLLKMQHFSGACLVVIGIFDGVHLGWLLANHRI